MTLDFVWHDGRQLNDDESAPFYRRSHLYGDGLFETVRVHNGKICFWESHYFRLMSSMRILRMDIPLTWSPEELSSEILSFDPDPKIDYRVRLSVWRNGGIGYAPVNSSIDWSLHVMSIDGLGYPNPVKSQTLALFQEHKKSKGLLSNLKMSQSALYVLTAKFAKEQNVDDAILLSEDNRVLETSRGNVFVLSGNDILTPPLDDGVLRGVIREQVLKSSKALGLNVKEGRISPFDLLSAKEIWITNAINGIMAVSHYRKSTFESNIANEMQNILLASCHSY
ncbi:MAG: Aminodeoxychorismate lyase [Owenweeksia sp. TMED14]|nr:MAG: Aminodeoxychorismate lyase [Owenweeksia sp. TMED14]